MKNKKQANKINIDQEFRRLGVFIEHVDSNVGLIAEQYGEIRTDINGIKADVNDIKKDVDDIKNTLNSHTDTLNSHTEMIGKLAVDMEIVKTDIELIKHSFKKKIDVDEFAALERRVLILEKRR